MKISITIPALNEENNIQKLLKSFENQTYKNFEVVIVDNGSLDNTKAMVEEQMALGTYPLKLLIEEKKGVGFARRKGMNDASARGFDILVGTDADSYVRPDWIESIIKTFEETQADCLFGLATFDWSILKTRPDVHTIIHDAWIVRQSVGKHITTPARGVNFAITRKMYDQIGGMPQPQSETGESLPGEDIELRKLVEAEGGKIGFINSDVVTSPRRVLRAIIKDSPNDYYKDFEDVRSEEEIIKEVLNLDIEKFITFTEATLQRIFIGYIVGNIDTKLWDKAKVFVSPQEDEFISDSKTLSPADLYKKYRDVFVNNSKEL